MRQMLHLELERDLRRDSILSEADYDVLSNLSEGAVGGMRVKALADWMLWSQSRLSHHLGRMEGRALVLRRSHADDGRGAVVVMTDRGRATLEAAAALHVRSVRRNVFDCLTRHEVETLGRITDKLVRRLSEPGPGRVDERP